MKQKSIIKWKKFEITKTLPRTGYSAKLSNQVIKWQIHAIRFSSAAGKGGLVTTESRVKAVCSPLCNG